MDISSGSSPVRAAPGATHRRNWLRWSRLLVVPFCSGCATSPISESLRTAATNQPSFAEISAHPESFKGRMVVLGGEVVQTSHRPHVTEIEVWQQPLNAGDRPENVDHSPGRFLVRCRDSPDPAAYAAGHPITVAGEIEGREVKDREIRPLGRFHYTYPAISYPVIGCRQIQLWAARPKVPYYYTVPYWFDPGRRRWPSYYYPYYYEPFRRPY
jgi:outer membrane lipoprotein